VKAKVNPGTKSISWRMKLPRTLHAQIKKLAEAERREINWQCIKLLEEALTARAEQEKREQESSLQGVSA